MAIVKSNLNRLLFAQDGESTVALIPGHNEIDGDAWLKVRSSLEDKLKSGDLKEVNFKYVAAEGDKPAELRDLKPLQKIEPQPAEAIIKETYHLPTLEAWKAADSRDAVRAAILRQIEEVEKHGTQQ